MKTLKISYDGVPVDALKNAIDTGILIAKSTNTIIKGSHVSNPFIG